MKKSIITLAIAALIVGSCFGQATNTNTEDVAPIDTIQSENEENWQKIQNQYNAIVSELPNPVLLDTLLENITCQQRVKILAELTEERDGNIYTYSGGGYLFRLELNIDENSGLFPDDYNAENTVFYDGNKRIVFRDYMATGYNDANYTCTDFRFDSYHYFINPRIIEVGGKRFLYSDVGFPCNGWSCAQRLTMIYDLAEKRPTFIGNFRLDFEGFLLSDFNNNGIPDLLIIARTPKRNIEGTEFYEFDMKLLVYTYDNGVFKLSKDNYYDLYGMSLFDFEEDLSIIEDNWHKK